MFMDSDSGLNLGLGFDSSSDYVMMRKMLNQEEIFKNQVLELHRLYEIQKILMKEDTKLSSGECPHSFVGPFSENMRYGSLSTKMKLSHSSEGYTIFSSGSFQNHCLKQHRDTFEHQQLSLDLNLAATPYSNDSGNLISNCITSKSSPLTKHDMYDDKESSIGTLKLSLGSGADTCQKGSGTKNCKDKIICSPSLQAIHLKGSPFGEDHITIPKAKNQLEASFSFSSGKNDSFGWIQEFQSHNRDGREVGKCLEDLSCKKMMVRRKLFTSHEVVDLDLDLNKALPDESSVSDPWIFNPSQCTSLNEVGDNSKDYIFTVINQRQPKNNYSSESSSLASQDKTVSTLTISPSKDTGECLCKKTLSSVDIGSLCGPLSDSKAHASGPRNSRPENTEHELSVKKNKEGKLHSYYSSQELLEGTDSNRSPVSCKSGLITDDESSNTKTSLCLIDTPNPNASHNVMHPSLEIKSPPSDPRKEEAAQVDPTVRKGAVSLMYFSSECLARYQDYGPNSKKRKESCKVEKETPETSSDSYEAIVLKQQECSVDDYCISSAPLDVTGLDGKDRGMKLKRGRRMKDFRKEILPNLASLSRKEISEDIRIMELALRSIEHKKYRSKTGNRSGCIESVRSRRSRPNCVGQRNYS